MARFVVFQAAAEETWLQKSPWIGSEYQCSDRGHTEWSGVRGNWLSAEMDGETPEEDVLLKRNVPVPGEMAGRPFGSTLFRGVAPQLCFACRGLGSIIG